MREISFADTSPNGQSSVGQAKAMSKGSMPVSHNEGRDLHAQVFHSLHGCSSKKLGWKQSIWNPKRHSKNGMLVSDCLSSSHNFV